MKITQEFGKTGNTIIAYEARAIQVNERRYERSLILMPERLNADWEPQDMDTLEAQHFDIIRQWRPEIVILGTGARQQFPTREIFRLFIDAGIGLEVMDTPAACRTYNIIMAEGRQVAAALMMIR